MFDFFHTKAPLTAEKSYVGYQAHREGGVAGASAPGPGGPKGARRAPSKKKFSSGKKR